MRGVRSVSGPGKTHLDYVAPASRGGPELAKLQPFAKARFAWFAKTATVAAYPSVGDPRSFSRSFLRRLSGWSDPWPSIPRQR